MSCNRKCLSEHRQSESTGGRWRGPGVALEVHGQHSNIDDFACVSSNSSSNSVQRTTTASLPRTVKYCSDVSIVIIFSYALFNSFTHGIFAKLFSSSNQLWCIIFKSRRFCLGKFITAQKVLAAFIPLPIHLTA